MYTQTGWVSKPNGRNSSTIGSSFTASIITRTSATATRVDPEG